SSSTCSCLLLFFSSCVRPPPCSSLFPYTTLFRSILNMFLYQLFPKWKSYMIASIVLALIGTFIVEPLFAWGDIYILHEWKYIYSFPIYITFTTFLKWFVQKIKAYEEKMKKKI